MGENTNDIIVRSIEKKNILNEERGRGEGR